jgi:hypothetical protein
LEGSVIAITITRTGHRYQQTIARADDGEVTFPTNREHAMDVVAEHKNGRFSPTGVGGPGKFDTGQAHNWTWQVEVEPEAV